MHANSFSLPNISYIYIISYQTNLIDTQAIPSINVHIHLYFKTQYSILICSSLYLYTVETVGLNNNKYDLFFLDF